MKLSVVNTKGEDTGRKVDLKDSIYKIDPNEHTVYLEIKRFLASQRQGTHKTKERNEIVGSTKKIKRQKGTGTARAGSIKSPIFRGGGTIFGPRPRDYGFKLNKKVKILAKKSAFSDKASQKLIKVVEDQELKAPRTKDFISWLEGLSIAQNKSLFIIGEKNKNVLLSARNIPNTKVVTANEISAFDLINADHLVLFESAVEPIEKGLN